MSVLTTTLTETMATYYDKVFLERAQLHLVHSQYAQKRGIPANEGKTVNFTRHTPPAVATTALTEGENPSSSDVSASTVTATLAEYGNYEIVSKLYKRTSIDEKLEEQVATMGQNMGETVDTLVRTALVSGGVTQQIASAATAATSIAATDILDAAECRKSVRSLKKAKAIKVAGAQKKMVFGGIVGPEGSYDLQGDSTWQATQQYVNPTPMMRGNLGTFQGIEFTETDNTYITSTPAYATWVMGYQGVGAVSIDSEDVEKPGNATMILKEPGPQDTSNPLNRFGTIGWAVEFVPVVLNANWVVQVLHGATA